MSDSSQGLIWITWERQRRSIELAKALGARYYEMDYLIHPIKRYLKSLTQTIGLLARYRKSVFVVQNPSMVLAFVSVLLGKIFNLKIVVDRHTDRYILLQGEGALYNCLVFMSRFTMKHAKLTIVTNNELAEIVHRHGGQSFVLPDPLPPVTEYVITGESPESFNTLKKINASDREHIFIVAAWAWDEPIEAYIELARKMPELDFYISGRPKKEFDQALSAKPENFHCTGFVSDQEFYSIMQGAKCVVAVTTSPATLICAGYESLVLGKPFVTGDSDALKAFFGAAAANSNGSVDDIFAQLKHIQDHYEDKLQAVKQVLEQKKRAWPELIGNLEKCLANL